MVGDTPFTFFNNLISYQFWYRMTQLNDSFLILNKTKQNKINWSKRPADSIPVAGVIDTGRDGPKKLGDMPVGDVHHLNI